MNLARFCPSLWVEGVEHIDLQSLRARGYDTLLLDLDNTLVSWRTFGVRPEVLGWIEWARRLGFKMCLVSNCLLRFRVDRFARLLDLPAIPRARKPGARSFLEALALVGSSPDTAVVVGDQVFRDVLGGNRLGFYTVLVRPRDRTEWLAVAPLFQRMAESVVLLRLRRLGLLRPLGGGPANTWVRAVEAPAGGALRALSQFPEQVARVACSTDEGEGDRQSCGEP